MEDKNIDKILKNLNFYNYYEGIIAEESKVEYIKNNLMIDDKIPCVISMYGEGSDTIFEELTINQIVFLNEIIERFDNNNLQDGFAPTIELFIFDSYHMDINTLGLFDKFNNQLVKYDPLCYDFNQIRANWELYINIHKITYKLYTCDEEVEKDNVNV